jgi:predicted short-subunit dehydrogenase-like oxidoreductase (DUF2520 family)
LTKSALNSIVLIGSGNVATNLAFALLSKHKKIVQVVSRKIENAKSLAEKVGAGYTDDLKSIIVNADLYIIAVSDSAILEVISNINIKDCMLVHTAGSVDMDVLKPSAKNYGVIYPLQTLSKKTHLDFFNNVPLCIEANNEDNTRKLSELANKLSGRVYLVNSEDRKVLHLAAVFVNNFINYMYVAAARIMNNRNMPIEMLMPLIGETFKVIEQSEFKSINEILTGPAVRNDMETIRKHIELLKDFPDLKKVYELITNNIINN